MSWWVNDAHYSQNSYLSCSQKTGLGLVYCSKGTEQLYNTDNARLCRKRKGVASCWDMASCPQTDCPPLSFALCKELLASQTQGLFSSITRSVCPTLAGWVQPTSCCGDVCVGACKVGDTDVCVWWRTRPDAAGDLI